MVDFLSLTNNTIGWPRRKVKHNLERKPKKRKAGPREEAGLG